MIATRFYITNYRIHMKIDYERDSLLTDFGKATLKDRYLMPDESYQDRFAAVAKAYSDDADHAQRIYDYISLNWFMPATPILTSGGTDRGLPISCFLSEVDDSLYGIISTWNESAWLAARGGGIGVNWSNVRSINEKVGKVGKTSGVVPFLKVQDSMTLGISQGSIRRGSSAVYVHVSHPEVEEFLAVRRANGDPERKSLNIHNALVIDDKFMEAVRDDSTYDLIDPTSKKIKKSINAREFWHQILTTRIETGEPYLLFIDNVNRGRVDAMKKLGLEVKTSNLCCEIHLPTGEDHLGGWRTAVCCLSSLNLELFDTWKEHSLFIKDVLRFLDNVIQEFIDKTAVTPDMDEAKENEYRSFTRARYSAYRERSVGLGVMGLQSYLQSKNIPLEGVMAKVNNKKIFEHIKEEVDKANIELGLEKGSCPDNVDANIVGRFLNTMAIAPTASISVICGTTSPGIEPYNANAYTQKTLSGSFTVTNKHLKAVLQKYDKDTDAVWKSISLSDGSVQHLDFLSEHEKLVFKTAQETNNQWIIELACDRAPYIDQGQSVNVFMANNSDKTFLSYLHYYAWKNGLKGLYYCRSKAEARAEDSNFAPNKMLGEPMKYEDCLSCQ